MSFQNYTPAVDDADIQPRFQNCRGNLTLAVTSGWVG